MTALRRAFLAAVPPEEVLDVLAVMVDAGSTARSGIRSWGRSRMRWTQREHWHVTIQYFGKVADTDALVGALAAATVSVPAASVQLQGAGGFPSARNASVYWLGVADPEGLRAIHEAVMTGADAFVRPRDRVSYKPHVTLARLTSKQNLRAEVEALEGHRIGPSWRVDEVVLMESVPRPEGSVYRPIARFPLA